MRNSVETKLFIEMMNQGYIANDQQFKNGMLMNDEGKRLQIKQVFLKQFPVKVDVFMQYAHVVTVNGRLKSDPGVILGFDLNNKMIHPVLYRNDLLDHTIKVYQNGTLNQDNANWLLEYWTAWFAELKTDEYESLDYGQLKAG